MSNGAITWALELDLPTSKKFLLVVLADLADENDSCYPGQARLAKTIGTTDRTVRNLLVELEADGLISRRHRQREDGSRTSDRYVLAVGQALESNRKSATSNRKSDAESNRKSATVQPEVDDTSNRKPTSGERNPQKNPQIEPPEPPVVPRDVAVRDPWDLPSGQTIALVDVSFDQVWAAWPRKVGKKPAEQRWQQLIKAQPSIAIELIRARILEHARIYQTWPAHEKTFIPHLATWLNQERWQDEPPETRHVASRRDRETADLMEKARSSTVNMFDPTVPAR